MPDEIKASSSEANAEKESQDKSLETSEADSGTSEGDESQKPRAVPYDRFKQVNDAKNQAQQMVEFYQKTIAGVIDSPEDLEKFKAWKAKELVKAQEAEAEGEISPQKLAAIKKLMRQADPEYKQFLEEQKADREERSEAQFDSAEDDIREYAEKSVGIPVKNERAIAFFAGQVMEAIKGDAKLLRQWNSGNLSCVKKACQIVQEEYVNVLRKSLPAQAHQAGEKRKILRLPTLPSGGGASVGTQGSSGRDEPKGITKKTHDDAWAVLQSSMQE